MQINGHYRVRALVSFSVDDRLVRSYMNKYDCSVNEAIGYLSWQGKLECRIANNCDVTVHDTNDIRYDFIGTEEERKALEYFIYGYED